VDGTANARINIRDSRRRTVARISIRGIKSGNETVTSELSFEVISAVRTTWIAEFRIFFWHPLEKLQSCADSKM